MYIINLCLWLSAWISVYSCESCQVSGIDECYIPNRDCNGTFCSNAFDNCSDVTYIVEEPSNGIIKVKFPHPPFNCCIDTYTVFLLVNEEEQNDTCKVNSKNSSIWTKHSKRTYYVKKCESTISNNSTCKEYGEVMFGYVFSGCYKLKIDIKQDKKTLKPLESCPHHIRTNYIKSTITGPLTIDPSYSYKEQELRINTFPTFTFLKMYVKVEFKDSNGQHHPHSKCVLANKGTESNPHVIADEQVNGSCEYNSTNYISFIAEKVSCGNYSIIVIVDGDRCETDTLWTKSGHCLWNKDYPAIKSDDVPVVPVISASTMWMTVTVIVIAVHVIICICFFIRRQKNPETPAQSEQVALRPKNNNANVLLLYPRDCFNFMKTMSSFRRLLDRFSNIEEKYKIKAKATLQEYIVHDCYTIEEDLQDPFDWLRRVMNYPRLYIIVVTSHCAFVHQEALQSGDIGNNYPHIYINPIFHDSLFPYGLKQLMNDFSNDVYHRVHVIGFKGFSDENRLLALPSNLRRYNIPEHLEKLFSEMNLEYNQGWHFRDSAEYLSLQNNVKELRKYKLQNPNYLASILILE